MSTHLKPAPEYASIGKGQTTGKPVAPKLGKNARKKLEHRERTAAYFAFVKSELDGGDEASAKQRIEDHIFKGGDISPADDEGLIIFNFRGAIRHLTAQKKPAARVLGLALIDLTEQVVHQGRPLAV